MSRNLLGALVLVTLAAAAHAHGGIYHPPSDAGGTNSAPPTGPGPANPSGAGTPPAAGSRPDSGPPGLGTPRSGGRPGAPPSTGVTNDESFAWDSWVFWWEYNKDR